ncbi:MAG: GNAT family N-acetyltransferase [Candidatus Nanohalobium sp.]
MAFLETEGLELRPAEEDDLEFLQELKNVPEIRRFHPELYPRNIHQIEDWFESVNEQEGNILLVIWRDGERAGEASLSKPEEGSSSAGTGISVPPKFQGRGIATEAMEELVDYGFKQWNLHRVFAGVLEFNKASQKVWEKLGFEKEVVHRGFTYCEGSYQDLVEYGILESE